MFKVAVCNSLCCNTVVEVRDGTLVCSECGKGIEELVFNIGELSIVTPGDTVHMPDVANQSVQEVSMEIEEVETKDTICGRLKEAYELLQEEEVNKGEIGELLKMCVIYAKRMSKALVEYHKEREI